MKCRIPWIDAMQSLGSLVELCDQKVLINFFSSKRKLDTLEVHETEY